MQATGKPHRMYTITKDRLKQNSFIHQARMLERKDSELTDHMNKPIPTHCTLAAWKRTQFSHIRGSFPGIMKKGIQTNAKNNPVTMELFWAYLPHDIWTHAYTDGSAEEETRNGIEWIILNLREGRQIQQVIHEGRYSTNYKAEAHALKTAATR